MKRLIGVLVVLAVALGVVLVMAPSVGPARVGATTSTTSVPPQTVTLTLTNASNGSTVSSRVGDLVVVNLAGGPQQWSAAASSSSALVLLSTTPSATGSSSTTFRVAQPGSAQLTATGRAICAAGSACPLYEMLWRATVNVPVVDPPSAGAAEAS